jgi:dienelactone hydrolase
MYEHNGTRLAGYLAYDDAVTSKGKPPGILVFHEWWGLNDYIKGALDPLVNKDAVDAFLKAMNDGRIDFQFIEYSGALHAFTNPNADKAGVKGLGYNAEAASRSWRQMQLFFHEIFGA